MIFVFENSILILNQNIINGNNQKNLKRKLIVP